MVAPGPVTPQQLREAAAQMRAIAEAAGWARAELKSAGIVGSAVGFAELAAQNAQLSAEALEERARHLEETIARNERALCGD